MSSTTIEIPLSEVPDSVIVQIKESLEPYSTTLIKVTVDNRGRDKVTQIGSGTFVSIGKTYGILTAQHVARELDASCSLGLTVIQDEHNYQVDKTYLNILEIASAADPPEGPDLSFIALPSKDVAIIKAAKSFHSIDFDRQDMLRDPPRLDAGIWFICGTVAERTRQEESEKGFIGVTSFQGYCAATGVKREYTRGDYDYFEMDVEYSRKSDIPLNFGGMSGGGLWQVLIRQSAEGKLIPIKNLLSGVIFYQSAKEGQHRFIRCHGRRSIYENVYREVEKVNP